MTKHKRKFWCDEHEKLMKSLPEMLEHVKRFHGEDPSRFGVIRIGRTWLHKKSTGLQYHNVFTWNFHSVVINETSRGPA